MRAKPALQFGPFHKLGHAGDDGLRKVLPNMEAVPLTLRRMKRFHSLRLTAAQILGDRSTIGDSKG